MRNSPTLSIVTKPTSCLLVAHHGERATGAILQAYQSRFQHFIGSDDLKFALPHGAGFLRRADPHEKCDEQQKWIARILISLARRRKLRQPSPYNFMFAVDAQRLSH